ncbi:MAG: hypothetical protein EOP76_05480 [Variovorax sp.]|nr:MAG: hypothetical protein EOP76_05480 [Variovorax sp.]
MKTSSRRNTVNEERDIIVVGTAMGGLSAICKLLGGLPLDFKATVLVAFDSCSQPADSVLQILRHYSRADVEYARDGMLVPQRRVILTPQGQCMRLGKPGVLQIECSWRREKHPRPSDGSSRSLNPFPG